MAAMHFTGSDKARTHFADLLDAACDGRPATVRRAGNRAAFVDAGRLRATLAAAPRWRAQVLAESGSFAFFVPGAPIAGSGHTFDEAIDDMIGALREYADDWAQRLAEAPNHRANWGLVQLIELSDNAELRAWLTGA